MMKKTRICALLAAGCLISGFTAGACLAAEPERTGYIPPAHNFLYEDGNKQSDSHAAYAGNRMDAGSTADDGGIFGNSIRATNRRGYIPPAHNFLYE